RSLIRMICSGEALRADLEQRLFEKLDAQLHNLYGPTEASIDVTFWECGRAGNGEVPIGKPIANTQIYLLDAGMLPSPAGPSGELYIGGENLGRGYLNHPEWTSEKWLPNPFGEPGSRLYRSGDLARHRSDGSILYLGRTDHQVKIRGFRIETSEIESTLGQCPGVRETVVSVHEDAHGEKRLVAYVVGEHGQAPAVSQMRSHLQQTLPEYMTPSFFIILPEMPLTPNGKLDRRALPPPDESRPESEEAYVPAQTPEQEILAAVWMSVLGLERIGIRDNFFASGGDSIRSLQVRIRAQQRGLSFSLQQ